MKKYKLELFNLCTQFWPTKPLLRLKKNNKLYFPSGNLHVDTLWDLQEFVRRVIHVVHVFFDNFEHVLHIQDAGNKNYVDEEED